jgi:hypothetical protein
MASPLVEQFRRGGVSRDVRLTAASGDLPLKPIDQVDLLYLLSRDSDEEVRRAAEASLLAIPPDTVLVVLKDTSTHPKALDFFAARLDSKPALQAIIQNAATEDATIQHLATRVSTDLLELIVINQMRLLRLPAILEGLEANESLSADQRRRLTELRHDFRIGEQPAAEVAVPAAAEYLDLGSGPPEQEDTVSLEDALAIYEEPEEKFSEEQKEERKNLAVRLAGMNTARKMMEAMTGTREARMLLVRDRNRVVWSAVLDSPKLTESDIESITQMKNVTSDVLGTIGANGQWTRKYSVKRELVKNPVTPPHVALNLLPHLAATDLKRIANDRNVSEPVRRKAREMTRHQR